MTLTSRLVLIAGGVTALRLVVLALTPTDLFFDEAQYWAWGQDLAFGYFSKPPLIGWIIRTTTEIGGSDGTYWVRVAAPIFHGVTSLIVGFWLARIHRPAAVWGTALYLSMPILAIGSWMISTDTIMAPFLAGALFAWSLHLERHNARTAIIAGCLAGLAMMAKYAGAYFWLSVIVAAFYPDLRPKARHLGLALAAYAVVVAPNLVWNIRNDLVTFSHTADNASWGNDIALNWGGLAEFAIAQAFVIGPVFFVVWLLAAREQGDRHQRFFLAASMPVLLIVCIQALLSRANANWAFAAYLTAAPLAALWLVRHNRRNWLVGGILVNAILVLGLTILILWPSLVPRLGERYTGRTAIMQDILTLAGNRPIAARERQILADLTYAARRNGGTERVYAMVGTGRPHHWYDMASPRPLDLPVMLVTDGPAPNCHAASISLKAVLSMSTGAYRGRQFSLFLLPGGCE